MARYLTSDPKGDDEPTDPYLVTQSGERAIVKPRAPDSWKTIAESRRQRMHEELERVRQLTLSNGMLRDRLGTVEAENLMLGIENEKLAQANAALIRDLANEKVCSRQLTARIQLLGERVRQLEQLERASASSAASGRRSG